MAGGPRDCRARDHWAVGLVGGNASFRTRFSIEGRVVRRLVTRGNDVLLRPICEFTAVLRRVLGGLRSFPEWEEDLNWPQRYFDSVLDTFEKYSLPMLGPTKPTTRRNLDSGTA